MTESVKVLSDDALREIEARAKLPQCLVVVSRAVPNCFCRRPKDHRGTHSEPVHPEDSFWTNPDIPALCATVRALRADVERLRGQIKQIIE